MLQLWKLVLLCGLLTGTSEALLENLGNDLHDAVEKLKPVVDKGLETVDNTLKGESTKVRITVPALPEAATRGCPLCALYRERPFVGRVVSLTASLDLLTGVRVETDAQTQLPTVVLGECTSDPTSISLSLLDRRSKLMNKVADITTGILEKHVSFLVQKERQRAAPLGKAVSLQEKPHVQLLGT
ncbi:BPI fold-containing family A member 2 [Eulemur rufifrons]|uniref:BPI fold-containing family A member 2 n=1 Tax=Eulemur rufifrons TaxID=859984 RepID=UPI003743E5EF